MAFKSIEEKAKNFFPLFEVAIIYIWLNLNRCIYVSTSLIDLNNIVFSGSSTNSVWRHRVACNRQCVNLSSLNLGFTNTLLLLWLSCFQPQNYVSDGKLLNQDTYLDIQNNSQMLYLFRKSLSNSVKIISLGQQR